MARTMSMTRGSGRPQLSTAQRRRAERLLAQQTQANRMRRVHLSCGCTVRDSLAQSNDWLWCAGCSDQGRVVRVTE